MFTSLPAQSPQAPTQPAIKVFRPVTQVKGSRSLTRNIFELSSQFASDRRNRVFRNSGIILNILSALVLFLLLNNLYLALIGLLVSWGLFELCIRAVDERVAISFGMIVALYWGVVGWAIDNNIVISGQNLSDFVPPILVGVLVFAGSLGLHIWYVQRKI